MRKSVMGGGRLLAAALIASVAFGVPVAALADDLTPADPTETPLEQTVVEEELETEGDVTEEPSSELTTLSLDDAETETETETDEPVKDEKTVEPRAAAENSLDVVYVSSTGSDENGAGTQENPVATLAKAVKVVKDGGTIYLQSNIEAKSLTLVNGKSMTIDGGGFTVTRVSGFTRTNDQGRGGYNPAMIEVANGATLTLQNITLDDNFLAEADTFDLASGTSGNEKKVHDGIIASYGDGKATIELGNGTTLKNFGGLSAVYITGEGGEGATLIMKSGSKICDDGTGSRKGGYAAIFNHGGTVQAENGSSIEGIDGRAIYADNAGVTTFAGAIKDITSSEVVKNAGDAGVAYYGSGSTTFMLASGGVIEDINSHDGTGADSALHLISCTFKTEQGSEIRDIETVGIADMNGATVDLAGSITNCNAKDVLFRMRGTVGTFTLQETGSIAKCTTSDVALVYLNGGKPTITIAGTIDDLNKPALYMSSNGSKKGGVITLTETGVITNISGYGMNLQNPSNVTIAGTITNCSSYALQYYPKSNQSLLTIKNTATIENNNGGKAQVRAQNTLPATDAQEHIVVEPGGLDGNTTIDLNAFDVTLDTDYESIKLGNASSTVADTLKERVLDEHSDWTAACSGAVWMQPSSSEVHFTVPRKTSTSMKNSGLYVTVLELNEDGTVPSGNSFSFSHYVGTGGDDPVDVTIDGLKAGQSYAVMFFNNGEYTLAPDEITIYTGGGQGDENYDDGFPKVTLLNSIDLSFEKNPATDKYGYDLKSLEVNGEAYTATADESLVDQLVNLLEATYTYEDDTVATDDSKPGEYKVTLAWKDGLTDEDVLVNGNNVTLGEGTLIVRYIENVEGATSGKTTHELLDAEPTAPVEHAEAIAPSNSKFYTNDDTDREIDAEGVQILDDDLLIDEDGTDRQALLEQKAEEFLGAAGEGQAYRYDFHYLDLVDAYNGNAWVSASEGTTVYLPYPEGVTADTADELGVQVVHFKDLHREYGISGQAEVEEAIAVCELETMAVEYDANGIKFDVAREGFSPFAIVWKAEAHTITATAGEGGAIDPAGEVTIAEGEDQSFTITPNEDYAIDTVTVDDEVVDLADVLADDGTGSYTFKAVDADHTIEVTFRSLIHTITVTAGEGGTVTPSDNQTVREGEDVTFTFAPDDGYVVADVKVDGESVGKVPSYTFSNVTEDHAIEVTFEEEAVEPPAHEHVWSDWKCDGENHWKVCETCGAISEQAAHEFGDWKLVSEATETEKGKWERTCSVCGYVQAGESPVVEPGEETAEPGEETTEPGDKEIPGTGDSTNVVVPAILGAAGIAAVAGTVVLRKRGNN